MQKLNSSYFIYKKKKNKYINNNNNNNNKSINKSLQISFVPMINKLWTTLLVFFSFFQPHSDQPYMATVDLILIGVCGKDNKLNDS